MIEPYRCIESVAMNMFKAYQHRTNMNTTKLVTIKGLEAATGIPVRTLRSLYHAKKISAYRLGYRTVMFSPEKVREALARFEQKAIS